MNWETRSKSRWATRTCLKKWKNWRRMLPMRLRGCQLSAENRSRVLPKDWNQSAARRLAMRSVRPSRMVQPWRHPFCRAPPPFQVVRRPRPSLRLSSELQTMKCSCTCILLQSKWDCHNWIFFSGTHSRHVKVLPILVFFKLKIVSI